MIQLRHSTLNNYDPSVHYGFYEDFDVLIGERARIYLTREEYEKRMGSRHHTGYHKADMVTPESWPKGIHEQ